MRRTSRRLPEVSPFVQSRPRVRLKKVAKPVARVRASASSFMKPTISTSPLRSSWTTAGMSPSSFVKSIQIQSRAEAPRYGCPLKPAPQPSRKIKSPAGCRRGFGCALSDSFYLPHAQLDRPAAAGGVMVPVVVHSKHEAQAYRPCEGAVKRTGIEAFESGERRSLTPYGV